MKPRLKTIWLLLFQMTILIQLPNTAHSRESYMTGFAEGQAFALCILKDKMKVDPVIVRSYIGHLNLMTPDMVDALRTEFNAYSESLRCDVRL